MCMEYMDGGSLDKILLRYGKIPELIAGACGVAILDGLSYLKVRFFYFLTCFINLIFIEKSQYYTP